MERGRMVGARGVTWVSCVFLTILFVGVLSFAPWNATAQTRTRMRPTPPGFITQPPSGYSSPIGDISDILLKFHPYVNAQEEYSNNILLSPNRFKLADYITTVAPGVRFAHLQPGRYGVDLDVYGGYSYYKKNNEFSYWEYGGRLDSWYALNPHLTFRLRDYLVRSDASRETAYENLYNEQGQYIGNTQPDQYLLSTERGVHAVYTRNVVEPSVEYRFGTENLVRVLYRNNIYRNKNPQFEDSTENTVNPLLNYWFDIKNGITLEYILTTGHFETSEDLMANQVRGRYTHRLTPRLSLFGEYIYIKYNFANQGIGYDIHNPSLGFIYKFSPTLTGTLQGGYYWQRTEEIIEEDGTSGREKSKGPFFHAILTQTGQKTSYTVRFDGGYTRDYFTAQNLGFEKYYRGYATIGHMLTQRWSVRATGSMYRVWYPQEEEGHRKDWIWDARLGTYYMLFQWLTIGLEGGQRGCHSTIVDNSYTEYSGLVRITIYVN